MTPGVSTPHRAADASTASGRPDKMKRSPKETKTSRSNAPDIVSRATVVDSSATRRNDNDKGDASNVRCSWINVPFLKVSLRVPSTYNARHITEQYIELRLPAIKAGSDVGVDIDVPHRGRKRRGIPNSSSAATTGQKTTRRQTAKRVKIAREKLGYYVTRDVARLIHYHFSVIRVDLQATNSGVDVNCVSKDEFNSYYAQVAPDERVADNIDIKRSIHDEIVEICWSSKKSDDASLVFHVQTKTFFCITQTMKNIFMKSVKIYNQNNYNNAFNLAKEIPAFRDMALSDRAQASLQYAISADGPILALSLATGITRVYTVKSYMRNMRFIVGKMLPHKPRIVSRFVAALAEMIFDESYFQVMERKYYDEDYKTIGDLSARLQHEQQVVIAYVYNTLKCLRFLSNEEIDACLSDVEPLSYCNDPSPDRPPPMPKLEFPPVFFQPDFTANRSLIDKFTKRYHRELSGDGTDIKAVLQMFLRIGLVNYRQELATPPASSNSQVPSSEPPATTKTTTPTTGGKRRRLRSEEDDGEVTPKKVGASSRRASVKCTRADATPQPSSSSASSASSTKRKSGKSTVFRPPTPSARRSKRRKVVGRQFIDDEAKVDGDHVTDHDDDDDNDSAAGRDSFIVSDNEDDEDLDETYEMESNEDVSGSTSTESDVVDAVSKAYEEGSNGMDDE